MELNVGLHGIVTCIVRDAKTGEIISETVYDNIQTKYAKNAMAKWVTGSSNTTLVPPSQIQLGNGLGNPSDSDSALFAPIAGTLMACDSIQVVQTYYAQFIKTYQSTDPSGQYTEAGLLDANGNLWGHVSINQYKSNQQTLTVQWQVYFTYDSTITSSATTNYALSAFPKWMTGTPNTGAGSLIPPTQIILGSGTGTPSINDTSLFSPVSSTLKTYEYLQANLVTQQAAFGHTYTSSDPVGTFTEMALVDTAGNYWTHSLLNPVPYRSGNNYLTAVTNLNFTSQ